MTPSATPTAHSRRHDLFVSTVLVHERTIRGLARRLVRDEAEVEDVVQETLLRAYRFFDRFEAGTNARAWLCRILRNLVINRFHKARTRPALVRLLPETDTGEGGAADPETVLLGADMRHELERAVGELPEAYRSAMLLFLEGDLSYREIADRLDRPIGTVMSRLHRARRLVREKIVERSGAPPASP